MDGSTLSRRGFLASAALLALVRSASAESRVPSRLARILDAELASLARWAESVGGRFGACFLDAVSGAEFASSAGDVPLNPASNQKLVTTGVALRHLGPRYTFKTGVYGHVANGRVETLVLRSEGDPTLARGDLEAFARVLAQKGVKSVGTVLVDQSAFDERFVPPGFEQQPHEWAAFRAPVSAVCFERNSVLVSIAPTTRGKAAKVSFQPQGFVEVDGRIVTNGRDVRPAVRVGLVPRGRRLAAKISGGVPEASEPIRYRQRVEDPRLLAGQALANALAGAGIAVKGPIDLGGAAQRNELALRRSRPLVELLPELGKASDNFYAEMLLKVVALETRGRPASSAAGAEVAAAWLRDIGAWQPGTRIGNGSGLFDANRASARTLARLLAAMFTSSDHSAPFLSHLAVGGVDGTLRGRFGNLARGRTVLAKTGTLRDVVSLSGYVMDPDRGRPVAFSLLLNDVAGRAAAGRARFDRVVERVARELHAARREVPPVDARGEKRRTASG